MSIKNDLEVFVPVTLHTMIRTRFYNKGLGNHLSIDI